MLKHASVFLNFVNFLSALTENYIKPCDRCPGVWKTNTVTEKRVATYLEKENQEDLLRAFRSFSIQGYLIARLLYEGAKRISEVLKLKVGQINFRTNTIDFEHVKTCKK